MKTFLPRILLKSALSLAIIGLVGWSLRTLQPAEILQSLRRLDWQALLFLAALNGLIFFLFCLRWWLILLGSGRRVPLTALIAYRLAGFGISYLTPGPQFGGEPMQVYLLQRRQGLPRAEAISSVAVDKLLELLANFTFLAAGINLALQINAWNLRLPALLWGLVYLLPLLPAAYLLALAAGRSPLSRLGLALSRATAWGRPARMAQEMQKIEQQASSFLQAGRLHFWLSLGISALVWGLMSLEYFFLLRFLGADVTFLQAVSALTAARAAFLLPLPGGLGALEASQVFALAALGISPGLAVSAVLVIRARDLLLALTGLGLSLWLARTSASLPHVEPGQTPSRLGRTI